MIRAFVLGALVSLGAASCDDGGSDDAGVDADGDADADESADADDDGDAGPERLFSFAVFTDIHIGEGHADYGSPGFDDELEGDDEDEITANIAATVAKVNENVERYDIALVMVLGDLTDSGEMSEYRRGKEILDLLEVPYFPLLGNHDMWPYTATEEAEGPTGDFAFDEVWADHLEATGARFEGYVRAPGPVHNPERDVESYFIDFAFDYLGYHFVALDLVTRAHAPNEEPGVNSEADLHDFDGGTWPWFEELLAGYGELGPDSVFVFLHHPPTVTFPGIDCLTFEEEAFMGDSIRDNGYGEAIFGFFAGHHHRHYDFEAFEGQRVVVTDAAKENREVRVVQVFVDGTVTFDTTL